MKMCLIMNEITVPDNKIKKVLKHSVSRKTAGSFCIGDRLKCGSVRSVDVSVINVKKIKDIKNEKETDELCVKCKNKSGSHCFW